MDRVPSIPVYMAQVRGYTPKQAGESDNVYRQRLWVLAQSLYRRDREASKDDREEDRAYTLAHQTPVQPVLSVHEELGNAANVKLRRKRER